MAAADPLVLPRRRRGGGASMLLLLAALSVSGGATAAESAPGEVIATTAAAFATVVATRRDELEADLRHDFALVDEFLLPYFDLESSCRLILRDHWTTAAPEQRRRFVDALYRFMLASHGDALLDFRHDTIRVLAGQEEPVGQSTRVRTEIRLTGGSVFDVDFYMRLDDRGWRVVDVIAEGISYVRTYRTDFGLEIRADGLESLIARLENTAAERHQPMRGGRRDDPSSGNPQQNNRQSSSDALRPQTVLYARDYGKSKEAVMSDTTSRRARTTVRQSTRGLRRPDPRSLIFILCSTALVSGPGCTTTRTIDPQNQSAMQGALNAGDTVKATLRDGRVLELIFVEETTDHIVGRNRTDSVRTISRKDISYLEVTKVSAVKTVLLVGGIALVVGLAQYVAAYDAFLSGRW